MVCVLTLKFCIYATLLYKDPNLFYTLYSQYFQIQAPLAQEQNFLGAGTLVPLWIYLMENCTVFKLYAALISHILGKEMISGLCPDPKIPNIVAL